MWPRSTCSDWKNYTSSSGLFSVSPVGGCEFKVYCDMCLGGGDGWIVIQRRRDDAVAFQDKNWENYRTGFGDYLGNYWMGLEKLHQITFSGSYELYVGFQGGFDTIEAFYTAFSVGSENQNYKLTLSDMDVGRSSYNNDNDDGLKMHKDQPFTTYDRDNDDVDRDDEDGTNCADHSGKLFGGWWFGGRNGIASHVIDNCLDSNLNGKYYASGNDNGNGNGIEWKGLVGDTSITKTVMAIRRVE